MFIRKYQIMCLDKIMNKIKLNGVFYTKRKDVFNKDVIIKNTIVGIYYKGISYSSSITNSKKFLNTQGKYIQILTEECGGYKDGCNKYEVLESILLQSFKNDLKFKEEFRKYSFNK